MAQPGPTRPKQATRLPRVPQLDCLRLRSLVPQEHFVNTISASLSKWGQIERYADNSSNEVRRTSKPVQIERYANNSSKCHKSLTNSKASRTPLQRVATNRVTDTTNAPRCDLPADFERLAEIVTIAVEGRPTHRARWGLLKCIFISVLREIRAEGPSEKPSVQFRRAFQNTNYCVARRLRGSGGRKRPMCVSASSSGGPLPLSASSLVHLLTPPSGRSYASTS